MNPNVNNIIALVVGIGIGSMVTMGIVMNNDYILPPPEIAE